MRAGRPSLRWWIVAIVGAGAALAGGFALKDQCTTHQWDGFQYRSSCYNDIFALYSFRGLHDEPFPYIHGDGELSDGAGQQEAGDLEYPVGTGTFIGLIALISSNGQQFFRLSAAGLAVFGLVSTVLLLGLARDRRRVLLFALGPPVVLYAFHNWDLLAVAFMCGGLLAFHRDRDGWCGVLLGLGAAAKVFPGLIVPALFVARWKQRGRPPWRMIAGAAGAFVAANLPVMLINLDGWAFPWKFQSTRFPNFETWGYMVYRHAQASFGDFWARVWPSFTSYASAAVFVVGAAWLLMREMRRPAPARPYVTSMRLLMLFLLTAKVYSPQFALWVLPFFALVKMPGLSFAAFALTDAAVWFAVSSFFIAVQIEMRDAGMRMTALEVAVWVRYATLAVLIWIAGRREENVGENQGSSDDAVAAVSAAEPAT